MKIISIFNNKGGVGKSTLGFHLGHALAEMGKKVLLVDLDPQCNLTICGMQEEELHKLWETEDEYIDDYQNAKKKLNNFDKIITEPRSIHFLLKPSEDGLNELEQIPPAVKLKKNIDLIPGRLSIHKFENKIAERWSGVYQSDNLAIRTITNIREICEKYGDANGYDFIVIDTSPSLGILNKTIISTVDGFFIPAQPDMFSLYGIRNIGNSLEQWQKEFNTIYGLISSEKRKKFPDKFVQFLGYTLYNAKKYEKNKEKNEYGLANAHYAYAQELPFVIDKYIKQTNKIETSDMKKPIGGSSIMLTHNTYPSVAQRLKCTMWDIPEIYRLLSQEEKESKNVDVNPASYGRLRAIKAQYIDFASDLLNRVGAL